MSKESILERKIYRKRHKWKKWKAKRNFHQNLLKKGKGRRERRRVNRSQVIRIPEIFSLATDRSRVLSFIHSLQNISDKNGKHLFFDFSRVKDISHGAITILLSYIGWLNDQGFHASGNYPENKESKSRFLKSGFLNFFRTIGTRSYEKGESTIVAVGEKKTSSGLTAQLIRKCMKTVWGAAEKNTKVQGMLIELMANTINHAYLDKMHQKGWYFSVDHVEDQNKVRFCFVDNGLGILKTLNKKFPDKVAGLLGGSRANNVIIRAFDGEFGSRTKKSNRGRGLKAIKKVFEQEYIKSLKVITNDVFYDFGEGITEELNESFDGTFYFWEIDKSCRR